MKTLKFFGGSYPAELKKIWENAAKKDGFDKLWHWFRWLAQQRVTVQGKWHPYIGAENRELERETNEN
jgi:hypothetical protein